MPLKKIIKQDNLSKLINILSELKSKKIKVGLFKDDSEFIFMIGTVHEFGTVIRPKNAKALTVPLIPEALGRKARSFPDLFIKKTDDGNAYLCKEENGTLKYYYWLAQQVTIPARPFIRGTAINREDKINTIVKENLRLVLTFQVPLDGFLNKVGEALVEVTKDYITDLSSPAKSSITIKAEGGATNPLIFTGKMRDSISFRIE